MDDAPPSHDGAQPHVIAVVLNWNAREETLACLESLVASDWPRLTVMVVDNASTQDIELEVAERFADALFVRNPTNLGFSGGMNAGIGRALELDADYVLVLNNDTIVDESMVRVLVEAAQERPDTGIITPLEFFLSAPDTVRSAGLRCNLRHAYQGPPLRMGQRDRGQFHGVAEVDAAQGTAMLVPADAVRDVGVLDEELYRYAEDVDWSMRMRKAGKRIYVALEARLWHAVATAAGGDELSPVVTYYHTRNSFVLCTRYEPMRGPRARLRDSEIVLANLLHALRSRQPLANARAVFTGWSDYRRGRLGPRQDDSRPVPNYAG